jgi:PAS domain S-box-containing protein
MLQEITSNNFEIDFQSLFYNSPLPMSLLSTDMRLKVVNQAMLHILGYSEEEIIGKSVNEFTVFDDNTFDFESLKKLFNREINSYSLERAYRAKDGSLIPGVITMSLIDFKSETYVFSIFNQKMAALENDNIAHDNSTLKNILAINPDIHYIMDIENKTYIYQNLDILAYFGYSPEDIGELNKIDFLVSKIDGHSIYEVGQAKNKFKNKIAIGEFVEVEYKFFSKNEGWKWLRAKSTPLLPTKPGDLKLSYGIIQDITHQKEIADQLVSQEAFINQITNLVPDVVAVYDITNYKVIYSNLSKRKFLGYTLEEWTKKDFVKPLKEFSKHLKNQSEALSKLADGDVLREEVAYYNKKGIPRWLAVKSKVFARNSEGEPTQILVVVVDIDDHKTTLLKLAEAKGANKAIFGALRDLLIVVDREVKYKNVISGLEFKIEDPSSLIGKSLFDVLNEKDATVLKELVNACLDTGEVKNYDFEHTYPDDRPNAFFSNYISRLNSDEALIVVRDETQKKIVQNSLDEKINLLSLQNEQLGKFIKKNTELERFAYIIAHDLKEPLRSISAISELIELEVAGTDNVKLEKLLAHLSQSSARMTALIEGVLTYSKIDSERVEQKINIDEVVNNILVDLNTNIVTNNVQIERHHLGQIIGNKIQIRQLFQNLISNAIKFQEDTTPRVLVGKREDEGTSVYFIEDNGIGIEPEFREAIFRMFKRVNNFEKYPGQGIGLSLCKKIIDGHNGRIWIETPKKVGVRFCFTLNEN